MCIRDRATYKAGSSTDETTAKDSSSTISKKSKKASKSDIIVGKGEYKIVEDFKDDLIPEGFSRTKAEYDGKQYEVIKGDKKDITAFYLKKGSTKGFYIYDYETKKFSSLRNIKIASRMYTVVNPSEKASCLKKYTKKQITVIDQEVNAWVLNEEEGLYLLYAMNWNCLLYTSRYSLGFERIIRSAIFNFKKMGLEPVIYQVGYTTTSPNRQYAYDHRYDDALYLDKAYKMCIRDRLYALFAASI